MSVTAFYGWRLPGCGESCFPQRHDPHAHELWGLLMATLTPPSRVIRTGPLVIDIDRRRVTVDGEVIATTPREEDYLAYLAERLGHWCPNEDVAVAVWGLSDGRRIRALRKDGSRPYLDTAMVRTFRNRLQRKLGPAGRLIATRRTSHDGGSQSRLEAEEPT